MPAPAGIYSSTLSCFCALRMALDGFSMPMATGIRPNWVPTLLFLDRAQVTGPARESSGHRRRVLAPVAAQRAASTIAHSFTDSEAPFQDLHIIARQRSAPPRDRFATRVGLEPRRRILSIMPPRDGRRQRAPLACQRERLDVSCHGPHPARAVAPMFAPPSDVETCAQAERANHRRSTSAFGGSKASGRPSGAAAVIDSIRAPADKSRSYGMRNHALPPS